MSNAQRPTETQWGCNLLREMVRRYSPSGEERELARFLAEEMKKAGWETGVDEAGNFVGERGDGPVHLLFLGHIDTVRGEIPIREENGLLYGRGAVDAKGPLAAFLAAATRARLPRHLKITCVGAVEEETSSSRGARHAVSRFKPDFLIVGEPSGWDAICIGYKGNCHIRLTLEQERTHGASGAPSAGTRACRFWLSVNELAARFNQGDKATQRITVDVRHIETQSDGLTERAALTLDIRTPPGYDAEGFKTDLAAAVPKDGSIAFIEELPPVRCPRTGPLVRELRKAIAAEGGTERYTFKTGTSDMNIAVPAWGCPAVAYGPGDSSLDHTPNEHISLEEFSRSVRILQRAIEGLGNAASSQSPLQRA